MIKQRRITKGFQQVKCDKVLNVSSLDPSIQVFVAFASKLLLSQPRWFDAQSHKDKVLLLYLLIKIGSILLCATSRDIRAD